MPVFGRDFCEKSLLIVMFLFGCLKNKDSVEGQIFYITVTDTNNIHIKAQVRYFCFNIQAVNTFFWFSIAYYYLFNS